MKNIVLAIACTSLFLVACGKKSSNTEEKTEKKSEELTSYPTIGSIEIVDSSLNDILDPNSAIEILGEGYGWAEGPEWVEAGQYLLFSDVRKNKIYQWKEGKGVSLYLSKSGFNGPDSIEWKGSNGLYVNKNDQLVICQHGFRQISIMSTSLDTPSNNFDVLIANLNGKRLNSPNDLTFDTKGNLYFTDPPYGLGQQDEDPNKEISFNGVYKMTPDGQVTVITDSLTRPNGIALSNDEKTLYVANSDANNTIWCSYLLDENGDANRGKTFFNATALVSDKNPGLADGLKVDKKGNVFATGPGGVMLFSQEGKHLGTIRTEVTAANCEIGSDGKYLYITATNYLLRVALK